MPYMVDGSPFKYFSLREMVNAENDEEVKLILSATMIKQGYMMDALREYYRKPLNVSSWWRSVKFNKRKDVQGHPNSCHLDGIATDVLLPGISDATRAKLTAAWHALCVANGVIGGVVVYKWGMHFDSNATPMRYGVASGVFRYEDRR